MLKIDKALLTTEEIKMSTPLKFFISQQSGGCGDDDRDEGALYDLSLECDDDTSETLFRGILYDYAVRAAHTYAKGTSSKQYEINGEKFKLGKGGSFDRSTYLLNNGKETISNMMEGKYVCKFCSSAEVVYQQSVDDASCQNCGEWQN